MTSLTWREVWALSGLCLERVDQWDINVFLVAELSEKRPLTAVTYTVFRVSIFLPILLFFSC